MGRPPKDANHPLVRLRRLLSTPSDEVTRKDLAKRTGIPETSLRDIETGRYKLTPDVAAKISAATGVDPRSLLAGDDPLLAHVQKVGLNFRQEPFSKDTPPGRERQPEHREVIEELFLAVLDAAEQKKIDHPIYFSFQNWLSSTIHAFGLEDLFAEKLTERFAFFNPWFVPFEFRPKDKRLAKEWDDFDHQVMKEYGDLLQQDEIENPLSWEQRGLAGYSPNATEADKIARIKYEEKQSKIYSQAVKQAARKWKEGAMKAATSKPLSGKRQRSPGCPED